jgi:integrase
MLGIHTALRVSDMLRLNCDDVYDFDSGPVRARIAVPAKNTGQGQIIALNKGLIKALGASFPYASPGAPLRLHTRTGKAISRVQAYRLIRAAAEALKFRSRVSCHSLRKNVEPA